VQPGKVSVMPSSVQKAMSALKTQKWWRIPDGWWKTVPSTCSCHGKHAIAERRASGRPNHQSR